MKKFRIISDHLFDWLAQTRFLSTVNYKKAIDNLFYGSCLVWNVKNEGKSMVFEESRFIMQVFNYIFRRLLAYVSMMLLSSVRLLQILRVTGNELRFFISDLPHLYIKSDPLIQRRIYVVLRSNVFLRGIRYYATNVLSMIFQTPACTGSSSGTGNTKTAFHWTPVSIAVVYCTLYRADLVITARLKSYQSLLSYELMTPPISVIFLYQRRHRLLDSLWLQMTAHSLKHLFNFVSGNLIIFKKWCIPSGSVGTYFKSVYCSQYSHRRKTLHLQAHSRSICYRHFTFCTQFQLRRLLTRPSSDATDA